LQTVEGAGEFAAIGLEDESGVDQSISLARDFCDPSSSYIRGECRNSQEQNRNTSE